MGTTGHEPEVSTPEGTGEAVLEADLAICDAHHHLFEHTTPPYLLDALHADTRAGHRVVSSVYVEAGSHFRAGGPRELRPVGETEWVASLPHGDGLLAGIVGHADMRRGAAAADVLDAHLEAGRGRFRGIRHVVAWDPAPALQAGLARHGEMLRMPEFGEGVAAVGRAGLSFETWCYMTQLPQLVELVRGHPDVPVLVDHLGGPLDAGPYAGHRASSIDALQASLRELARFERVHLKLGGVGMACFGSTWTARPGPVSSWEVAEEWGDLVRWCIDCFGPRRCMFESNFPVDRASIPYVVLWNAFKRMTVGHYSQAERAELFHGTATRFYRLDDGG